MDVKTTAALLLLCLGAGVSIVADDPCEHYLENVKNETTPQDIKALLSGCIENRSDTEEGEYHEDENEVSTKAKITKRQIIKIPSGVTKLKVIGPELPARPKRLQPGRGSYPYFQKNRTKQRPYGKTVPAESEENLDDPADIRELNQLAAQNSNIYVKEVSPEEFFRESSEYKYYPVDDHRSSPKKSKKHLIKGSQRHKSSSGESDRYKSTKYADDGPYEKKERPLKHRYSHRDKHRGFSEKIHDYEEYGASSVHMKHTPAPSVSGWKGVDTPEGTKEGNREYSQTEKESSGSSHFHKKAQPPRDLTTFRAQYTSHNPYVATNFGLEDEGTKAKGYSYGEHYSPYDSRPSSSFGGSRYSPAAAASDHHEETVLPSINGLQIVQPPQLGSPPNHRVTNGAPHRESSTTGQKATIQDILQQDCPKYEALGYCSSPPRYPTVQIAALVTKCPDLQEIMNSPVPLEPQDDLSSFSSRSDDESDIIFAEDLNDTRHSDSEYHQRGHQWQVWSRSGTESETACKSEYMIIEPGYAREVTTGRWFVIVQNSDSSLQKVTVDSCSSPGKPCGGLSGLKCSRSGVRNGIKSTRCIQRYTHQRLISWDPEAPNKCPKIRIFRFPTACVCHLGLV